jgi:GrpB-like predicted nucleotidyltransferase (UPF0157 family)
MNHCQEHSLIELIEYRPEWPKVFERLRDDLMLHVADLTNRIEHVGSTAVPGLPAKPAIDLDVVVETHADLFTATERLVSLGYIHRNNLSTPDRRAFKLAGASHNLYVCLRNGVSLLNHVTFRDHLRTHPADAAEYAALKRELVSKFPGNKCQYIEGKTAFILSILERCGASKEVLESIRRSNHSLYEGLRQERETL